MALPPRAELERRWRTVHTLWLVECGLAIVVWAGLPRILRGGLDVAMPQILSPLFFAFAVIDLAVGYWFKQQALGLAPRAAAASSGAPAETPVSRLTGLSIVAVAMGGTPIVFGIISYVLNGGMNVLSAFCALALIGLLFLRPNFEEWEAAAMRGPGGDAGRRPRG